MLEILLVFMVNGGEPEVSDRVFGSFDECKYFVELLAGDSVVNPDYGFEFLANDGIHFSGQCIKQSDYFIKESV